MKTTVAHLAVTMLLLGLIVSADGQDMLTPELRTTPTPSPTASPAPTQAPTAAEEMTPPPKPEEPPAATPQPTAAETPAPPEIQEVQEQRATPTEKPAATPRTQTFEKIRAVTPPPAGARPSPAAASSPPAPSAPAPARETRGRDRAENRVDFGATGLLNAGRTVALLRRLEKEWEEQAHDEEVVERLVANDFVGVGPDGKQISKRSMLQRARRMQAGESAAANTRSMDVKLFGPDVAVVTGVARESGRDRAGKKFNLSYRFTDTWMLRDNRWQCIASHAMLLP